MWRQSRQLTVLLPRSQKHYWFTHRPTNENQENAQDDKKMTIKSGRKDALPPAASPLPRSSMSGLLSMIAERKRPSRTKKTVKDTSRSVVASFFIAEDQTKQTNIRHQRNASASPTLPSLPNKPTTSVSLSLVEKLRRNVHRKRSHWESLWNRSPSVRALPVWQQRADWCSLFLRSSATPLVSTESSDALRESAEVHIFVCNAPTGSGKSSLVPLFLLDSHWQRLMQRIDATHPLPSTVSSSFSSFTEAHCNDPVEPLPTSSAAHYVQAFAAISRVCIVVSQPTRLACVELANFTAKLLAMADPTHSSRVGEREENGAPLVGGRVGYAVGGDVRYSPATEIIFATPGFILNALHFANVSSTMLSPTTLVIDEAHCRDMETDLLLAWARRRLNETGQPLRQLVLMSATLSAAHMMALFDNFVRTKPPQELIVGIRRNNNNNNNHHHTYDNISVGSSHDQNDYLLEASQGRSFRVETYYLDELPDSLHSSQLLKAWLSPERNVSNLKNFKRAQVESLPLQCQLLSPLASRVLASLMQFFSYTRHCPEIHAPQARAIAQLALFTLQSLTAASRQQRLLQQHHKQAAEAAAAAAAAAEEGEKEEQGEIKQDPESILVFLPGFAEMSLVLQSLEQLCPRTASPKWESLGASNTAGTALLQYEQSPFSVALLHATAIGSPQQQLRDTAAGPFRHRIILATTVAESSVTIPNVRCVIDSCLERRLRADPLTGVTLRTTALASGSSARQRAGRTGRTCDGIVIHLAPRRVFAQSESTDFGEATNLMAPLYSMPESVAVSPTAVLLRVKCLFPSGPSALLRYMPSPPAPPAVTRGMQELSEMGLIELHGDDDEAHMSNDGMPNTEHDSMHCYDRALLTAKGEFVAYLPIPYEQALLVYYALQFACVEEAVLLACAMTVPSLFVLPRVTASETETPAIQFSESLTIQRKLAGFHHNGKDPNGKLSEPLMLLALLREWYACSTSGDIVSFLTANRVNRSALRLVDSSIAQCSARIAHLLTTAAAAATDQRGTAARADKSNAQTRQQSVQEDSVAARDLHGEHDVTVRMPSGETIAHLIGAALPLAYRAMLRSSLLRLRRAALERVGHRLAVKSTSVAQWYPHDDQLAPLLLRSPDATAAHARPAGDVSVGLAQHRLCAAFVAAFARHTMRGEDGAHRVHHRRLLRNLSALNEDAAHTCSFGIELHTAQRRALYDYVTPAAVQKAIEPYVVGANMRQLELFATGRTAVVRFADGASETDEERSKADAEEEKDRERRLTPSVLSFEQQASREDKVHQEEAVAAAGGGGGEAEEERTVNKSEMHAVTGRSGTSVSLAPFGVSLLVAVQSSLSRLTLFLSSHKGPAAKLSNNTSQETQEPTGRKNSQLKESEAGQAPLAGARSRAANGIRFRSVNVSDTAHEGATDGSGYDMCVTWHDNYGQEQILLRSAVQRAGYTDLFPMPFPVQSDETLAPAPDSAARHAGKALAKRREEAEDMQAMDSGANETDVLMSVQRITFTHALRWQVTLPLARVPSNSQQQQQQQQQLYCCVCHSVFPNANALAAHCRGITHLSRLALTVRLSMQRDWIAAATSATIDDLRERNGGRAQLRSCVVGSGSFLNALQWSSRLGSTTMSIAVAGSLVGSDMSNSSAIKHKDTSSPLLHAMHVWVLDGAAAPPSLFVIAGYLVAASVRFDAALLMNEDHSMAYAVMLHDWGVWTLPTPLTRGELRGVMEVFAGRPWRGVARHAFENVLGESVLNTHAAMPTRESAGLHWCTVSDDCPQCTYSRSGERALAENAKRAKEEKLKPMHSDGPSGDEMTESALLLVLHEYRNSARSVFSLTDYMQRVVAKLNLRQRIDREGSGGAEMIARFVARRRQQPLEAMLRDLGCQFITGESNEKLFLLPTALPSYLPAPDFATILRRHRQRMRQRRVIEKGPVKKSQPLF